ncbi:MAG: hypothetical protein GXP35_05835 [Actinobacteria bacterium]|nr:hypothetical protein [Actinomycetota bacterium]
MKLELVNARLTDGRLVDVEVTNGAISMITEVGAGPRTRAEDTERHDLKSWLLLPATAEPHAHLDKALTAESVPNPKGDLLGAIQAWIQAAKAGMFTHENTVERATASHSSDGSVGEPRNYSGSDARQRF